MNVYEAFMAGADYIERNPHKYNFIRGNVPSGRDDGGKFETGCMWGWAGHFYGIKEGRSICKMFEEAHKVNPKVLSTMTLYNRAHMHLAAHGHTGYAVAGMRDFAETYFGHLKPVPLAAGEVELEPAYLRFKQGLLKASKGVAAALAAVALVFVR